MFAYLVCTRGPDGVGPLPNDKSGLSSDCEIAANQFCAGPNSRLSMFYSSFKNCINFDFGEAHMSVRLCRWLAQFDLTSLNVRCLSTGFQTDPILHAVYQHSAKTFFRPDQPFLIMHNVTILHFFLLFWLMWMQQIQYMKRDMDVLNFTCFIVRLIIQFLLVVLFLNMVWVCATKFYINSGVRQYSLSNNCLE